MECHGIPGFVCPAETSGTPTACTTQSPREEESTLPNPEVSMIPPSPSSPQSPSQLRSSSSPSFLLNDEHNPSPYQNSTLHRDQHPTPLEGATTYTPHSDPSSPQPTPPPPPPPSSPWENSTWPSQGCYNSCPSSSYALPASLPPSQSQQQQPRPTGSFFPQTWNSTTQQPPHPAAWGTPVDPVEEEEEAYSPAPAYFPQAVPGASLSADGSSSNNSLCFGRPEMSSASWPTHTHNAGVGPGPYESAFDYRGRDISPQDGLPGSYPPSSFPPYPYQYGPFPRRMGGYMATTTPPSLQGTVYPTVVRQQSDYDEALLTSAGAAAAVGPMGFKIERSPPSPMSGGMYGGGSTVLTNVPPAATVHSQHQHPPPCDGESAGGGSKMEEPYARLIYRAFMSNPRHAMTLQEIYQWFRENTDKDNYSHGKEGKGWQNSIRHNLSMNAAFTKRERVADDDDADADAEADADGEANEEDGEGAEEGNETSSPPASTAAGTMDNKNKNTTSGTKMAETKTTPIRISSTNAKKSTEWVLQDWAVRDGVQSTTRYRNSARRSSGKASSSSASRSRRARATDHRGSPRPPSSRRGTSVTTPGGSRIRNACLTSPGRTPELSGGSLSRPEWMGYPPHRSGPKFSFFHQGPPPALSDQHQHQYQHQHQPRPGSGAAGPEGDYAGSYTPSLFLPSVPGAPTVKSEGENDEVITPEASFSFHEPNVLLPEIPPAATSNPYANEMVTLYSSGSGASQVDLSSYNVAGGAGAVFEDGLFHHGCAWNQDVPYSSSGGSHGWPEPNHRHHSLNRATVVKAEGGKDPLPFLSEGPAWMPKAAGGDSSI